MQACTRTESDFLGTREVPAEALYGIHSLRARENFPDGSPFPLPWYKAMGMVKLAYFLSTERFIAAMAEEGLSDKMRQPLPSAEALSALVDVAREMAEGKYFEHFIVPGISGGAGTSINLNVCEILANAALIRMGEQPGRYDLVDPLLHANAFQSTNDVVPSALHLAIMAELKVLEETVNALRAKVEEKEREFLNILRPGFTQMQEDVPTSWGKLLGSYSEALSRDWWRITRCAERIKVVNLGGGAVGTGLGVPRFVIMDVIQQLQRLTALPLTRAEHLPDATANHDVLAEVHGMLKPMAINLEKMASDLRLLASDLAGQGLRIPGVQAGSSIMPGKVNPVIPEFVISASHQVYANDGLITRLCAQGTLELNAYLPVIGQAMLSSMALLTASASTMANQLIAGMELAEWATHGEIRHSPSVTTALIPYIGYHKAGEVARRMKEEEMDVYEACLRLGYLSEEQLTEALLPSNLLKLGYSVKDLQ
ncbi:MAG: aspartate ammonia-lyase [Bacteroidales bacterium]|nr:aspartate ammonia-lyase [Bacteroidales bacterium]